MCNPPFYSSAEDVAQSAEAKESEPNAVNIAPVFSRISNKNISGRCALVRMLR